jgi:hypothetical protein
MRDALICLLIGIVLGLALGYDIGYRKGQMDAIAAFTKWIAESRARNQISP